MLDVAEESVVFDDLESGQHFQLRHYALGDRYGRFVLADQYLAPKL